MTETALDLAARGAEDPSSDPRVFEALFNAELFLLLDGPPEGEALRPTLLELEAGPTALAFDLSDRLAAFIPEPAGYAAMPGRALVAMLAGRGVSLAVNPGVAPSELFYGPEALDWAAAVAAQAPQEEEARIGALTPPAAASPEMLEALSARLAALSPVLAEAWLVGAGGDRLLLALRLRVPGAEGSAARALGETGRLLDQPFDLAFVEEGSPLLGQARRIGLGFELPAPAARAAPSAPGTDPDRPPRLR